MKPILVVVLAFALLLWVALWWLTGKQVSSHDAPRAVTSLPAVTSASHAPLPVAMVPALREHAPSERASSPSPMDNTDTHAATEPFKPKTESSPTPLPAPVKPNEHGVIDLSADPSTKAFSEALAQGYRRRLEQ